MKKERGGLTVDQMSAKVHELKPGDVVEIPADCNDGVPCKATVVRIYPRIVQFEKEGGVGFSLGYFDAMKAVVIKPSGFEEYNEEMAVEDMISSLNNSTT